MFAVPSDFVRGSLVQSEAEWWFVLPHLPCHVVSPTQFVCETIPKCVEHEAAHSTKRLCCEELNLGIRIVWLDQACRMHLNPLEINGLCTDGFTHLDCVTCAMFTVGCGQMQQIWTVLGQQRIVGKIGTKSSAGENDRTELFETGTALLVDTSRTRSITHNQLRHPSFGDDFCPVSFLGNLFNHLNQCIGDCHAWETLLASVGAGS
mmetsp:Transcript_63371/g.167933  ORF Transcript_63371/g.167933 Transcript_63371/m.167933 type:complete len:206 (-) Transcript_63371:541-1158(-)